MINSYLEAEKIESRNSDLREKLNNIGAYIGNTPLKKLAFKNAELYVKLEYNNFSGSIKDRAAFNILSKGIEEGTIDADTMIIESSSGNFGIALATLSKILDLRCTVVIDPNINPAYEHLLSLLATNVIKVDQRDETGGYLLNRIDAVKQLCANGENYFWTNQYENPSNYQAYYKGLGVEICNAFEQLDYVFVGVSTCGTITGISRRLKEHFPDVKIIAIDIEGSVIFGDQPKARHISGLGASKVPPILDEALIDFVINVPETDIVTGGNELLLDQAIFGGASAGASYYAIKHFFKTKSFDKKPVVLFLCPDKGTAYLDNIYNPEWVNKVLHKNVVSHT